MFSTLRWQSLGFLIGSIMLCGSLAQAATYHVSKTGNNGNSCATAQSAGSSAKLTIAAGLTCLSSGDTLTIRAGTYTGEPEMSPPSGATIQGAAGETVIIRPTTDRTSLFISRNNDLTYRNFIVEQ